MKRFIFGAILLAGLGAPAWADFQDGLDAHNRGDYASALREWIPLAERGNARAQHELGIMYAKGLGVSRDYAKAASWFRKAAEQGHALSQKFLGDIYRKGRGLPKDDAQAVKWYREAAKQGHALGQKKLGDMYRMGRGVPKDYAQAVKWYRESAKQGEAWGQLSLGRMYEKGRGVPRGYAEAVKWYRKAADQGNAKAKFRLGSMYERGTGVAKDVTEAIEWYRKAATLGLGIAEKALRRLGQESAVKPDLLELAYKGITLIAVPPRPGVKYDVKLVGPRDALDNLRKALDFIQQESPFSVAAIETLKENGNLVLVYNPSFGPPVGAGLMIAAFFPDFFKKDSGGNGRKDFVVVVGPHGIKWPTPELSGVLVHELVGHGMQNLQGRMEYIRVLDLECAASLYEEKFYQDSGRDKTTKDAIEFRQALKRHWCSDFMRYLRARAPSLTKLWDVLDPDVPRLLEAFNNYAKDLRDRSVSGAAIQAALKLQKDKFEKWVRQVAARSAANEQYQVGVQYRDGLGTPQDHTEAAKWLRKAAQKGFSPAQSALGFMYEMGLGVSEDYAEAVKWYRKAAKQGLALGQAYLAAMYAKGWGVKRNYHKAARWYRRAADQDHVGAQIILASMYLRGQGVPKDLARAYFWLTLVVERHEGKVKREAVGLQTAVSKHLTSAQMAVVKKRARAWSPKKAE